MQADKRLTKKLPGATPLGEAQEGQLDQTADEPQGQAAGERLGQAADEPQGQAAGEPRGAAGRRASPSPPSRAECEGSDAKLEKIWSRRMALLGLKRIYLAALEGARTEIRDEDGALIEVKFNPTAANAATKAIEVANKMLGYTTPSDEDTEGQRLTVELLDAEEFAE